MKPDDTQPLPRLCARPGCGNRVAPERKKYCSEKCCTAEHNERSRARALAVYHGEIRTSMDEVLRAAWNRDDDGKRAERRARMREIWGEQAWQR